MAVEHMELKLPPFLRGFHVITDRVLEAMEWQSSGILQIFIQHTSAGICINEAADSDVLLDFETFFNHIVPEGMPFLRHTSEGIDDMPAHVKSTLVGHSLQIPVARGRLLLGTWQGIYLCEFRNHAPSRKLVLTWIS